ncbi:MAG: hypothetical protein N2578_00330 [Bdellovibrionaceae bacterium]|nr:hypothetical protein [Pseudobdellovibrionaceae bacterium]
MLRNFIVLFAVWIGSQCALAQSTVNKYFSPTDKALTIKRVTVIPFEDNVGGIYSRPLTEKFIDLISKDSQWTYVRLNQPGDQPVSKEKSPDEIKRILRTSGADAALYSRLSKGPSGISAIMTLYVGSEGLPLVRDEIASFPEFQLSTITEEYLSMFERLRSRIPYRGTILSRRGIEVTLDIGAAFGLRAGDEVSAIQIIAVDRHPKHKFVVASTKEILGKIRINKVEHRLSFGTIALEKEPEILQPGTKVLGNDFVVYRTKGPESLAQSPDGQSIYGPAPSEWLPAHPAQYGKLHAALGISQYAQTISLQSAGSISALNNLAPTLYLGGEVWITQNWYLSAELRQGALTLSNSLPASEPARLNMTTSRYALGAGYNLLLDDGDPFGTKLQFGLIAAQRSSRVERSTPLFLSGNDFGGNALHFAAEMPFEGKYLTLGLQMKWFLTKTVSEVISSGNSTSRSITDYGFYGKWGKSRSFKYIADFNFEHYEAGFDGTGERSDPNFNTVQTLNHLYLGIEYYF